MRAVFDYLLGSEPLWVSAVGLRVLHRRLEDVGFVSLRYPGNILCNLHVSWTDPHKVREIVVVGSKGRAVFDDLNRLEPLRIYDRGVHVEDRALDGSDPVAQLVIRDGDIHSPSLTVREPLRQECLHLLDCIHGDAVPRCDGYAGTAVVRVMEAIDESLRLHGAPAPVSPLNATAGLVPA